MGSDFDHDAPAHIGDASASNGHQAPEGVTVDRPSRPIRKDERIVSDRGLYIESWLPERRSRRKPLYMLHGELGGSWLWQRFLGYFAPRGWEGHALNLRGHYWSETADFGDARLQHVRRRCRGRIGAAAAAADRPRPRAWRPARPAARAGAPDLGRRSCCRRPCPRRSCHPRRRTWSGCCRANTGAS